ncbi:MAG: hypothetical protein CMN29_33345 [Sandaracinus sp.]|nr:hypothetical protein [Sandaracinus sp.]
MVTGMSRRASPASSLLPVTLLVLATALAGCADQTAIVIEVTSSDLRVPEDIDQLRVVVEGEMTGTMADRTTDLPGTWPQTLAIRPGNARVGENIRIRVFALQAGEPRIRRVLPPTRFESGNEITLRVQLSRDCLDVMCTSPDADCVAGLCTGEMPMDAGVDAGPEDDAGTDAGMPPMDAGTDADVPPMDAGTDAGAEDAGTDAGPMGEGQLLLTEYVEGTSNNKAIEVTAVGGTVDATMCSLLLYSNGSTSSSRTIDLSGAGALAEGASYVVCHGSADAGLSSACDELAGTSISHNGDDAYELRCAGVLVDSFGRVGEAPASGEWSAGGVGTQNQTLRRKCSVIMGDTDSMDPFDPSIEWDSYPLDTFDGLGEHCP